MKRFWVMILICVFLPLEMQSAEKKPLDHTVYDSWQSIAETALSSDGAWLLYALVPQEGDARLLVRSLLDSTTWTIPRGSKAKFTQDARFVIAHIQPLFQETRKAKIARKKDEEMPKDSLAILRLSDGAIRKVARVKSFQIAENGAGWLAYQLEKEKAARDTCESRSIKDSRDSGMVQDESSAKSMLSDRDAEEKADKEKKCDTSGTLLIRRLSDDAEWRFPAVTAYQISKSGERILFACSERDSTQKAGVYLFDTAQAASRPIKSGKGDFRQLVWDEAGEQALFLADTDTSKRNQRFFSLFYWKAGPDSARLLIDTLQTGFPEGWLISENQAPLFSKDGEKVYLGTAPVPIPEDTSLVDFETAKLDIWHWQDPLLQSSQLKKLDDELKRSYTAIVHLKNSKFVQLAGIDLPELKPVAEGNAGWALGLSNLPWQLLLSWEGGAYQDIYLVRTGDGSRALVASKIRGPVSASPNGKYLLWFDETEGHWFCHAAGAGKKRNLTAGLGAAFANELNDLPDSPRAYGLMGWTEKDRRVLVYDRYDIWALDPEGVAAARNVTRGLGRQNQTSYRYLRLDPEEIFLQSEAPLLLKAFDYRDKSEGFCRLRLTDDAAPIPLFHAAQNLGAPLKAKMADRVAFTRASFVEFPDLWVSDGQFAAPRRMSDANPQQQEYLWGSVELMRWHSADGKPLEGLLYKPEDFDPAKKYPLIVYFYERNADLLHRHHEPRPSASTVSPVFYASRGYLFFIPDIVYETGYPGKSALNCILPGVQKLIELGFADPARIGIQGQSWGGYQVAWLVTRTNLFRCAGAGAPVSNMTSAYGGIRWESGMVRQFQYEHAQSRIGGSLWEKPWHYIENSPLFHVPDVTTPLLIMHNDGDGAVPWYQGIELFTALRRLGKPAWMLVYNGEAHNLKERKNRKDLSVRLQQFFDHYLKDEPMPAWMKSGLPATLKGKSWGLELAQ